MRQSILLSLVALALVGCVGVSVPPARPPGQEPVQAWFHYQLPGGRSGVRLGFGPQRPAFRPYIPSWLPDGLDHGLTGGSSAPGAEYVTFEFHPMPRRPGDDRFIRLVEGWGEAVPGLPAGREVMVGDQRAVWTDELGERHQVQADPPTPAGAQVLAWRLGEVQIELVSNLSESDMLAVAASLVPMRDGKGPW